MALLHLPLSKVHFEETQINNTHHKPKLRSSQHPFHVYQWFGNTNAHHQHMSVTCPFDSTTLSMIQLAELGIFEPKLFNEIGVNLDQWAVAVVGQLQVHVAGAPANCHMSLQLLFKIKSNHQLPARSCQHDPSDHLVAFPTCVLGLPPSAPSGTPREAWLHGVSNADASAVSTIRCNKALELSEL